MQQNRRFVLVRRPDGAPRAEDFAIQTDAVPDLAAGELLIRNHYASLDPGIRSRLGEEASYMPPVPLGRAVGATTIGVVEHSRADGFAPGQWVMGMNAIEDYSIATAGGFTQLIDPDAVPSVTHYLSVLGAVGLTGYFGYLDICKPQGGETVLVTAASGAVGSVVGQIARIHGAGKVIGIAGGPEKCARLIDHYGYDVAIDYRGKDVGALDREIRSHAADGIDIIFENVGGQILDAGLLNLADGARVALCGLISEYNNPEKVGARNIWQLIMHKAMMRGFLVSEYLDRFPEGSAQMAEWLKSGAIRADEHIEDGIDNAFSAFMRLFSGTNHGKMILRLA